MKSLIDLLFRPSKFLIGINKFSVKQSIFISLSGMIIYILILIVPYIFIIVRPLPESIGIPFQIMSLKLFTITIFWYPFTIILSCLFIWLFSILLKVRKNLNGYIKLIISLGANQLFVFIPVLGRLAWILHSVYVYNMYFKERITEKGKYIALIVSWLIASIFIAGLYLFLARVISLSFISSVPIT